MNNQMNNGQKQVNKALVEKIAYFITLVIIVVIAVALVKSIRNNNTMFQWLSWWCIVFSKKYLWAIYSFSLYQWIKEWYKKNYGKDMVEAVKEATLGDYKNLLVELCDH